MTNTEAREIFNQAILTSKDADQIARIEIVREYLCNPNFRKAIEDHVWQINNR
jgi:hypothetical protein